MENHSLYVFDLIILHYYDKTATKGKKGERLPLIPPSSFSMAFFQLSRRTLAGHSLPPL
jgi:hypothetical protein